MLQKELFVRRAEELLRMISHLQQFKAVQRRAQWTTPRKAGSSLFDCGSGKESGSGVECSGGGGGSSGVCTCAMTKERRTPDSDRWQAVLGISWGLHTLQPCKSCKSRLFNLLSKQFEKVFAISQRAAHLLIVLPSHAS